MNLEGGCACGEVRYRIAREPIWVNCCHCVNCQRQTGTAFVINAIIETAHLETLKGEPEALEVPRDNGPHDIYRCGKCGIAVWSDYGRRPGVRFIRVGTLDAPGALKPGSHIFTKDKLPWVPLPADIPSFEVFYDAKKLWPRESLVRWLRAVPRTAAA